MPGTGASEAKQDCICKRISATMIERLALNPVQGLLAVSQVHKTTSEFTKGKAILGLIGPVGRARQVDLWPDSDNGSRRSDEQLGN